MMKGAHTMEYLFPPKGGNVFYLNSVLNNLCWKSAGFLALLPKQCTSQLLKKKVPVYKCVWYIHIKLKLSTCKAGLMEGNIRFTRDKDFSADNPALPIWQTITLHLTSPFCARRGWRFVFVECVHVLFHESLHCHLSPATFDVSVYLLRCFQTWLQIVAEFIYNQQQS